MVKIFDGHCDSIARAVRIPEAGIRGTGGHWDLDRIPQDVKIAQLFAFFWINEREPDPPEAVLERYYSVFRREMDRNADRIVQCRTGAEVEAAFAAGKHAAILSVEGGELLNCSLKQLHRAYEMGVRAVNLTWNFANAISGSNVQEPERGLSSLGKEFVREMEKLGMLPDVSHLSDAGFWDLMEITEKPVIASHSNSRSVHYHTRNLTDEQFKAIMEKGGTVGLNACAEFVSEPATEEGMLRHLEHFLELGGEKTVALGGDWDGIEEMPAGWSGIWSWCSFRELLLRRNYPEDLINDLFYNNFARVVSQL